MAKKTRKERIEKVATAAAALEERLDREHPGKFRVAVLGTKLVIHLIQPEEESPDRTP